jgi:hypothetical protein
MITTTQHLYSLFFATLLFDFSFFFFSNNNKHEGVKQLKIKETKMVTSNKMVGRTQDQQYYTKVWVIFVDYRYGTNNTR